MREYDVPPPRRPYLIMNPRSGGGKVTKFGLKDKPSRPRRRRRRVPRASKVSEALPVDLRYPVILATRSEAPGDLLQVLLGGEQLVDLSADTLGCR
jgi:hypothetical protein